MCPIKDLENSFSRTQLKFKENKDTRLNHMKLPKGFNKTDAGLQRDSCSITTERLDTPIRGQTAAGTTRITWVIVFSVRTLRAGPLPIVLSLGQGRAGICLFKRHPGYPKAGRLLPGNCTTAFLDWKNILFPSPQKTASQDVALLSGHP